MADTIIRLFYERRITTNQSSFFFRLNPGRRVLGEKGDQ